jgi:hypothetical protein
MPTLRCLRRTGDQPSHLSDRALSLITPHSKHSIAVDGGAAAVWITDQRRFCGLDLSTRSGPFSFQGCSIKRTLAAFWPFVDSMMSKPTRQP